MILLRHKNIIFLLVSVPVGGLVSKPVYSSESESDHWQFQVATYAWLAVQKGAIAPFNGVPTVDIDVDFWDDIQGNINGALYLLGEARKGNYGVLVDISALLLKAYHKKQEI